MASIAGGIRKFGFLSKLCHQLMFQSAVVLLMLQNKRPHVSVAHNNEHSFLAHLTVGWQVLLCFCLQVYRSLPIDSSQGQVYFKSLSCLDQAEGAVATRDIFIMEEVGNFWKANGNISFLSRPPSGTGTLSCPPSGPSFFS